MTRPKPTPASRGRGLGFKIMDPARHREVARLGGLAAQAKGTGHQWDREEARIAGAKGGMASGKTKRRDWHKRHQ